MTDEAKPSESSESPTRPEQDPTPGPEGEGAKKTVDEDWKAEARREQEKLEKKLEEKRAERSELPAPDFVHFVSGIAAQTLMQLGDIENPFAGEKKVDLESARYSIDIIAMLEEKTKGNLTPDEERYLKAALHDLRMRYVEAASGKPEPPPADAGADPSGGDKS